MAQFKPIMVAKKENLDDIFQVGCLGLLKAIDNFDFSHGVRFSTYAVPMIIGEIRRYLRDNSPIRISRSLKDIAYKALQFKEKYINEFQKEPTIEMIAKELGEEEIDVTVTIKKDDTEILIAIDSDKAVVNGSPKRVYACTRCLRSGKVTRAV